MAERKAALKLPNLLTTQGRTSRLPFAMAFWGFLLLLFLILFALIALPDMVSDEMLDMVSGPALWVVAVAMVFIYMVLFCVTAQRLHDVGLSAWIGIVLFLGVIFSGILPTVVDNLVARGMLQVTPSLGRAIHIAIDAGNYGYLIAMLLGVALSFWPGTAGDNRFGAAEAVES